MDCFDNGHLPHNLIVIFFDASHLILTKSDGMRHFHYQFEPDSVIRAKMSFLVAGKGPHCPFKGGREGSALNRRCPFEVIHSSTDVVPIILIFLDESKMMLGP